MGEFPLPHFILFIMGFLDNFVQGLAGAGVSSLFSGISSIFNHSSQKRENERNRDFTREMFDKQVENNIKMWNLQNQYDLPKNQIERLRQAGINPDLYYSGGSVSASSPISSASPSASSSGYQPVSLGQYDPLTTAQIGLINAQTRNLDADTDKKGSEKTLLDIDAKTLVERNNAALDNLVATTKNLDANTRKVIEGELPTLKKQFDHFNALIRNLDQDTSNKNQEHFKIFWEGHDAMLRTQLTQKEIKWFDSKAYVSMQLDLSAMGLNDAQATHLQQQIDTYFEQFDTEMDKLKADSAYVKCQSFITLVQSKLLDPLLKAITEYPDSFKNAEVAKAWTGVIKEIMSAASSVAVFIPK